VLNMYAKFDIFRFYLYFLALTVPKIWRGPKISKVGHVTPSRPSFILILHFLSSLPLVINLPAKFEVSSFKRFRDMEGSQNLKSRSHDPFTTCKYGVAGNPIFEFPDPDLPIHYTTFMGLYDED